MRTYLLIFFCIVLSSLLQSSELLLVDAISRLPLSADCRVLVYDNEANFYLSVTAKDGRVPLPDIDHSEWQLRFDCTGYFDPLSQDSKSRPFTLPSATMEPIEIQLTPFAQIEGTVFDLTGHPYEDALVSAYRIHESDGRTMLIRTGAMSNTDQHGSYRLHDLPPGKYMVALRESKTAPEKGPLHYHLNSGSAGEALTVDVRPGATTYNVDIIVSTRPTGGIEGRLTGIPADLEGEQIAVQLISATQAIVRTSLALANANGEFRFDGVAPGNYYLASSVPFRSSADDRIELISPYWTGTTEVFVAGEVVVQVQVNLSPPVTLQFSISEPTAGNATCSTPSYLSFVSTDPWFLNATFASTHLTGPAFTVTLPPGSYKPTVTQAGYECDVIFKSASNIIESSTILLPKGIDESVIVETRKPSAVLSGHWPSVRKDGEVFSLTLVKKDNATFMRRIQQSQDPMFSFRDLPCGEYLLSLQDDVRGMGETNQPTPRQSTQRLINIRLGERKYISLENLQ
jgi:hypothetical protein